jgi:4-carboxymuconolactone decarboxylase
MTHTHRRHPSANPRGPTVQPVAVSGRGAPRRPPCRLHHLTRTGIDIPTRELLTFAMLVSLGGCESQVKGHVSANLNVGNDRVRLLAVLTQLIPFIGYPRTLNGLRVLDEVTGA